MKVTNSPETRNSLLVRLCDPHDREAWYQFASIYEPLIYRIGRRHGLQDADAQNLVQEVLGKIEQQVSRWESGRPGGGFRRWLATVARNAAIDVIRRVRPDDARGGTSVQERLNALADREDSPEAQHRRELERQAFRLAARRVREQVTDSTWTAFWETEIEGKPCKEVADLLGKTVGAIHTARSRIMERLRKEVEEFDWQHIETEDEVGDPS